MSAPVAKILTTGDLAHGMKAEVEFTVTAEDMRQFALLSGDYNPLHMEDAFARKKNFAGAVVYGALMLAKVSQLIGMQLPGRDSVWSTIAMQFKKPLFVGQRAIVEGIVTHISEATGMIELAITICANDQLLAKGKAEVLLVRS